MSTLTAAERRAFSETADPHAYVPRPATEAILARLDGWRRSGPPGATLAALMAPPGLGKTLLLRLFEARLGEGSEGVRGLYLPYAGMALPELCAWVHGLLGRRPGAPGHARDDLSALAALALLGEGARDPFYLLVDDAESMPLTTARSLARGLPPSGSPLRLLLAIGEDARATRLLAALADLHPVELRLHAPMSEEETFVYLSSRMHWAGVPAATRRRFVRDSGARLHALSGGVPRRLHRLASELLAGGSQPAPGRGPGDWRQAEWLGRPIEEGEGEEGG